MLSVLRLLCIRTSLEEGIGASALGLGEGDQRLSKSCRTRQSSEQDLTQQRTATSMCDHRFNVFERLWHAMISGRAWVDLNFEVITVQQGQAVECATWRA
jgi:hypothetical protein